MKLTDLTIQKLKAPETGQKTYYDDGVKGFGVRVSVGGAKSFVVMYGKRRKLQTLGRYPDLTLAKARTKAKQFVGDVIGRPDGDLPSVSFVDARERFLEESRARNKASTLEEYTRLLKKHFLFTKKIHTVTRHDCMQVIEGLKATPGTAIHAYLVIRTMMNWAVGRGLLVTSPVPPWKFKTASRTRILKTEELRAVWRRAEEVGYPYGPLVQLLILTGQRRGEITGLRRSWIENGAITFPLGFCKNKREHTVPLGQLAQSIIAAIPEDGDLLFPARGRTDVSFSGWSKAKRQFDEPLNIAPYALHDLRRTFASELAALGTPIHVTEKLLNHVSGTLSGVAGIYNRYSYAAEMRTAVEAYEARLQALISFPI